MSFAIINSQFPHTKSVALLPSKPFRPGVPLHGNLDVCRIIPTASRGSCSGEMSFGGGVICFRRLESTSVEIICYKFQSVRCNPFGIANGMTTSFQASLTYHRSMLHNRSVLRHPRIVPSDHWACVRGVLRLCAEPSSQRWNNHDQRLRGLPLLQILLYL